MHRTLIAAALLAATPAAFAQSQVSVFGIADAGISREQGGTAGSVTRISSGIVSASRFGFRGSEDLGQGLSALFHLETGVRIDTGEPDSATVLFNRQAFVGLRSTQWGTVTLGRQYTPYYNALSQVGDPFAAGYAGSSKNLFATGGSNTRTNNTLAWVSPKSNGFTGEFTYSLAETAAGSIAGRQVGAGVWYATDKLNARLVVNYRNNAPAASSRNTLLVANYDFGPLRAYGSFAVNKGTNSSPLPNTNNPFGGVRPTASTDSSDVLVGLTAPFGATTLIASYISKNDHTVRNQDASQLAFGATHALSKRSQLYASIGKIDNRRGAGYTVGNNSDVGSGDTAYNAGIRHTF